LQHVFYRLNAEFRCGIYRTGRNGKCEFAIGRREASTKRTNDLLNGRTCKLAAFAFNLFGSCCTGFFGTAFFALTKNSEQKQESKVAQLHG